MKFPLKILDDNQKLIFISRKKNNPKTFLINKIISFLKTVQNEKKTFFNNDPIFFGLKFIYLGGRSIFSSFFQTSNC